MRIHLSKLIPGVFIILALLIGITFSATVEIPPHPSSIASAAAHCRRARSSKTGRKAANFLRTLSTTAASMAGQLSHKS